MNTIHRQQILLSILMLCIALPVYAHSGHIEGTNLQQGLLHPLTGMDHLLALIAVGALAVQRSRRLLWLLPALFLFGLVAGSLLAMLKVPLQGAEFMILLSVIVLGGILYFKPKTMPVLIGSVLLGFSLFHGYAHSSMIPAHTSLHVYVIEIFVGSAIVLFGSMSLFAVLKRLHCDSLRWSGIGFSIAGLSLIAAI